MQEAYKAIADPTRRRILKYLRNGERTAGELAEYAQVGRTALSHHLMVLKVADLVRVERRGQFQVYSLNTTVFQDLLTEILGWLGGLDEVAGRRENEGIDVRRREAEDENAVENEAEHDQNNATEV